jgi:hypothetical protein
MTIVGLLNCLDSSSFLLSKIIYTFLKFMKTASNNPYRRWIETYASEDFGKSVEEAINIFDDLALNASPHIKQKMLDAFYKSVCLEWHFWNDAYEMRAFDSMRFSYLTTASEKYTSTLSTISHPNSEVLFLERKDNK